MIRPSRSASSSNLFIKSSFVSTELDTSDTEFDKSEGEEFAWIENVPEGIEYALNISQIYCFGTNLSKEIKVRLWLEVMPGIPITNKITKILYSSSSSLNSTNEEEIQSWQMRNYDTLLNLGFPLKDLKDDEIELLCEIEELRGHGKSRVIGSMKIFDEKRNLRSGLVTIITKCSGTEAEDLSKHLSLSCNLSDSTSGSTVTPLNASSQDQLIQLEQCLYKRKKGEVPDWHIKLLKDRLENVKKEVLSGTQEFVINLIIPEPTLPLKVKNQRGTDSQNYDYCLEDVCEAQRESLVKRNNLELFKAIPVDKKGISSSDLRAINVFLERSYDCIDTIPPDLSNLIWSNREYLSRKFPMLVGTFIRSIQWTLDVAERDEALKTIETWRLPVEMERKTELIYVLLIVMAKINNLKDSSIWIVLFKKLFTFTGFGGAKKRNARNENDCTVDESLYSPLILFMKNKMTCSTRTKTTQTSQVVQEMPELVNYFQSIMPCDYSIYWTMKGCGIEDFFIMDNNTGTIAQEIGKQVNLFEAVDKIFEEVQKMKGNRMQKLERLKKELNDPERGILKLIGQRPLIPGLRRRRERSEFESESKSESTNSNTNTNYNATRISSIVVERTNLFKSTALASLLIFITEEGHSLPLIFKRGDDLRRDAACLNIFRLIWRIWWEDGRIELFPEELLYGIVPIGREGGIVEFVESKPISMIIKDTPTNTNTTSEQNEEYSLLNHLKSLKLESSLIRTNFMKSCVGSSLLTYILGIGDRHLDNLLLTPAGCLFHIDFSFWFGNDPKPFAPPIKMTKEMVRAIEECGGGGERESEDGWNEFKGLCFTALGILRKRSGLILAAVETELSLLESSRQTITDALNFIKERLGVDLSQAETLQRFDKLLEESRSALFPQVIETIHKWAQYWKT